MVLRALSLLLLHPLVLDLSNLPCTKCGGHLSVFPSFPTLNLPPKCTGCQVLKLPCVCPLAHPQHRPSCPHAGNSHSLTIHLQSPCTAKLQAPRGFSLPSRLPCVLFSMSCILFSKLILPLPSLVSWSRCPSTQTANTQCQSQPNSYLP